MNPLQTNSATPNYQLLPLLGTVSCGYPTCASELVEDIIIVPAQLLRSAEDSFLLRVRGDALSGEGILPRDLVVVLPTKIAEDGDLVVALLGEEALLGRLVRTSSGIQIAPSNPAYSPINIISEDCSLIGRVVGVLRDYEGSAY